jgi:hypothetical protein
VTFSAYLVQYRTFRDSPAGYRAVNFILHALATVLLWTLLKELDVPGAYLAAALFAVHPVQVATVAWIAQQKVLWCAVFFIPSLLVYFRFCGLNPAPEDEDDPDASRFRLPRSRGLLYALAMLLLLLALLSQAIAVAFVPIVLIVVWWRRGHIARAELKPLIFPAALTLVAAVLFTVIEYRHGAQGAAYPGAVLRIQLIGYVFWSDLRHIVAPIGLSYVDPQFALRAGAIWQYLPTLALIGRCFWRRGRLTMNFAPLPSSLLAWMVPS